VAKDFSMTIDPQDTEPDPKMTGTSEPSLETGDTLAPSKLTQILRRVSWPKVGLFIVSLFLFILALTLMKDGARGLAPVVQNRFSLDNPANTLGFGWLFAYLIMSGSPVAASALTFLDAGIITPIQTFTMIIGSRMGASFIILFIGFIYVLRGRNRSTSLSMGLLSFTVTGTLQLGSLIIGTLLLLSGVLDRFDFGQGVAIAAITDLIFDPISAFFQSFLPSWALFIIGLGIILVTFNLFDRCLPEMTIKESQVGRMSRLVYQPMIMFLLGSAVTLVSMSVSVSLSILVPLSHRGFVRRENVIPYIMGANITTFIDTLLAAVLLNSHAAVSVVLAEMLGVGLSALLIMVLVFRAYERTSLHFVGWVSDRNVNLALFMFTILIIPLVLILI
jgi:solute carrier family 34 (sodium-dependent phosphate cotransporter)